MENRVDFVNDGRSTITQQIKGGSQVKRAMLAAFIIFLALDIEAQAQTFSVLSGTVTEVTSRWLGVKSDEGAVVRFRVGRRTVYPSRVPLVGDKVKVEYLVSRGVNIGYTVTVLESTKKPIESRPQLSPGVPPEISVFVGKWEGSWDNRRDMYFTLTIPNINLEAAEVKYNSKELQFSETAKIIRGEKTRIEWSISAVVKPQGEFVGADTRHSLPLWYSFEIQKDGTLEGTFINTANFAYSREAVMRRVD